MSVSVALRSEGTPERTLTLATLARVAVVLVLGALLLALEIRLRGQADIRTQIVGQLVAFALFLPAAILCWRGLRIGVLGVVLVLAFAVGFRAAVFEAGSTPPLSTDLHRYAWDARVQAAGINPYRFSPLDPALTELRDDVVWPRINLPRWHTVYPPGAEASFLAARAAFGNGLRSTTWLFLAAEAAAIALLVLVLARLPAKPPLERVALYAWHPLAISEIAAGGHVDALAVTALAGFLAAWQVRRFALAGAAVAFAALVKLGPALLVPALARRGGRAFVGVAVAVCILAYLPYIAAGTKLVTNATDFLDRHPFGGSLWWLLEPRFGKPAAAAACAALVLVVVVLVSLREHDSLEQVARSCLLVLGTLLLTLSYVQPWYALWLLPFFAVVAAPGWLWLTGTVPLLYWYGLHDALPGWVRAIVYGGLGVCALLRVLVRRRPPPAPVAPLESARVAAVIPALDEARALPGVLAEIPQGVVDEVIVVDGGSRDGTPELARRAGARVVVEPRRGYGRACAAGVAASSADVIAFLDGDGSDDPRELGRLVEPVLEGRAALTLGARTRSERGALLPHQRLGNHLVAFLIRRRYGVALHDVPPMRAVRRDTVEALALREPTYGWPTEMVVKVARSGLSILELEMPARARRGGESKIAGRAVPSLKAGIRMLAVVARYS